MSDGIFLNSGERDDGSEYVPSTESSGVCDFPSFFKCAGYPEK